MNRVPHRVLSSIYVDRKLSTCTSTLIFAVYISSKPTSSVRAEEGALHETKK